MAGIVLLTLAVAAILTGCTTRTAGMQAPLAHDYDGLHWRPLDIAVEQFVIVAPAYTALVENDPATTPEQLRERIELLPEDVRAAELVEVRVAVRPIDDLAAGDEAIVIVLASDRSLSRSPDILAEGWITSFPRDGDWLVIDDPSVAAAGEALRILLIPDESGAVAWEYAITPGRTPYGGMAAALLPGGDRGVPLDGAMGFQTIFAQNTNVTAVLSEGARAVLDGFTGDLVLLLVYIVLLAGLGVFALAGAGRLGRLSQRGR